MTVVKNTGGALMKRWLCAALAVALVFTSSCALAERAQVQTPGGWLNMRAKPDTKAAPLKRVPNHAVVTFLEQTDDTWSHISYQGVDGYVQTAFLNLTKTAEGKEIYPDGNGTVYVRKTASGNGEIIAALPLRQPLTILKVDDEWTQVSCTDTEGKKITGYILTDRIDEQYTTPQTQVLFLKEMGITRSKQTLYEHPSKSSQTVATLPKGQPVQVWYIDGDWCQVEVDFITSGYLPTSAVTLTGEDDWETENHLLSYTATYYLCTVPSGSLPVYAEPTGKLDADLRMTIPVDPDEKLPVVQHAYQSHGAAWAQVICNGEVHWTPTSSISVSDETDTMYYERAVPRFTRGTVYAGENGTRLYAAGSRFSKVLATIPAGTELDGDLRDSCISVNYKGQHGYVFYDEVICGLAQYVASEDNWCFWEHMDAPAPTPAPVPTPLPDESNHISAAEARSLADAALKKAYQAKNTDKMQVNSDKVLSKRGSTDPVYEFAYFQNGKYMYNVLINAVSGKTEFTADYTGFGQTLSYATEKPKKSTAVDGEISAAKARSLADQKLLSTYGGFDNHSYKVVNERFENMKGYSEPVFRINYWAGEEFAYTCVVSARKGTVLYHTDMWDSANTELDWSTPTPAPVYESTVDIGKEKALSLAKAALAGKYPDFDAGAITRTDCTLHTDQGHLELPYYYITFFVTPSEFYSCAVHAYTGKILETFGMLPGEGNG